MSDSDDSETAEWEREQMLRGTRLRQQTSAYGVAQPKPQDIKGNSVDVTVETVKSHIRSEMDKLQQQKSSLQKDLDAVRLEHERLTKAEAASKQRYEDFKSHGNFFESLAKCKTTDSMAKILDFKKPPLSEMPDDLREMLELLQAKVKPPTES